MDVDINLISSLSKALKREIKYICMATLQKNLKESVRIIFCLGQESFHIIDEHIKTRQDYVYEDIELIILDRRNTDQFYMYVKGGGIFTESIKLQLRSFPREKLIKNFMCYYSILYMFRYAEVRDLKLGELTNESKKQLEKKENEKKKGKQVFADNFGKFKKLTLKKYCFFVKHTISSNYNNIKLKINYIKDEDEPANSSYFSEDCEVNVEISEEILLNQLQRDDREMSFYAFNHFSIYMRNTIKSTNYWIMKNSVYHKKLNLNEDKCTWDGWIIECRISDPIYKNLVFIYYRRKYLPPFFERFIDVTFILEEKCSAQKFQINPKAYDIIYIMANTIHPENVDLGIREYERLLKAKFEGLLFDDDNYYYFQNVLKIYGKECYLYGFAFLLNILNFLEENIKEKDKISPLKSYLDQKKKNLFGNDNEIIGSDLHKKKLRNIMDQFIQLLDPYEIQREEERKKLEVETTDGETKKAGENTISAQRKAQLESKINWISKVLRFLCFCINGGLTDYGFTLETFIFYLNRCPTNTQEYFDFIYRAMDIKDLDSTELDPDRLLNISSLTENSKLSFNEEVVAVCIKSGWLSKFLCAESTKHCPNFIKLLLTRYLSNKILYSVCEFLKMLTKESMGEGGGSDDSERKEYSTIIAVLVSIFSNARNCPTFIILSCKSLCALISNENDYKNRLILIQNEIISKIAKYLEDRFDEKMVLCLLELLLLVLPEAKLTILNYLYHKDNLMDKLKNLLEGPGIAGTYFSIRTYVKIITIFLSLSNIHQADLRNQLNSDKYKNIYAKILRLLDEKNKVFEPTEEMSYVLEYKIYYLLSILIFKNLSAQEILIDQYKILDIIEEKCGKYYDLMKTIIECKKNKTGLADQKIESLVKTISKFYEMITYILSGHQGTYNSERIKIINVKNNNFNNLFEILTLNDTFISNYETLLTSFLWIKKLLRSIETEDNI